MNDLFKKLDWGKIVAWMGAFLTVVAFVSFFVKDLPSLLGFGPKEMSQAEIVATLGALQSGKADAEFQLTQIAVANQQSANLSTQQALNAAQAGFQATLDAIHAEQDSFIATQNANVAAQSTANAASVFATQGALDAQATQNALAQIQPTATPAPVAVSDYRSLADASVSFQNNGQLDFSVKASQGIPDPAPEGLAYVWLLDTDHSAASGMQIADIGADVRVSVTASGGSWLGTVQTVASNGSLGDSFLFADIKVNGPNLSASLDPAALGIPGNFDWVARTLLGAETYPMLPESGHFSQ
jgi:hypothetical protein